MSERPLSRLAELAATKASGELVCEAAVGEIHVYLQAGRIAWATDSEHPFAFSRYLRERAQLDDATLRGVLAECQKTRTPLGEGLVAAGLATPELVRTALRHQIGSALERLDQCTTPAAFLPRPQYLKYHADLTFELKELFPEQAAAPSVAAAVANVLELRAPATPDRPVAARSGPPETPTIAAPPPVTRLPATEVARPRGMALGRTGGTLLVGAAVLVALAGAWQLRRSRPAAASAPPAAASNELVFGMASGFSGAVKELGRGMRVGVETAFAAANEGGGVNGRMLKLVALDDGYDPARTLQVMRELVDGRKVFGIVGNVGTATAAVSVPFITERKVLFYGALSGGPLLRRKPPERYVFNYRPSYAEETAAAVRYLLEVRRLEPKQIAVFHQDDDFGTAGLAGVGEELRKARHDPATLVGLTYTRNSADVGAAVARLKKEQARIKAVVMVATSQAAIQLIQQARDAGISPIFTNVSAVNAEALSEGLVGAGAGYTDDVVVTQIVPLPTSRATAALEFQAALEKHAAGEKPGFVSFEGYLIGKILVEALRRAGTRLDTEVLVEALENLRGLDLGIGAPIGFEPGDHQGSHKVWGTALQPDGTFKAIKLE